MADVLKRFIDGQITRTNLPPERKEVWLAQTNKIPHLVPPGDSGRLCGRSYEQSRVAVLEFLDTDVLHVSLENCVSFLDPVIESWDIDLATFGLDIVLNPRVVAGHVKRFEFVEREAAQVFVEAPGLREFLEDPALSGTATEEEVAFLRRLNVKGRRPTPLYYYRELQNLRDPLHFRTP